MLANFWRFCLKISIHAPRTGSDNSAANSDKKEDISIHAPRTGSDRRQRVGTGAQSGFQSTLPARGATVCFSLSIKRTLISIHAPRTGSDGCRTACVSSAQNFNPRSPHGERLWDKIFYSWLSYFNPRSPHGERQQSIQRVRRCNDFNPRSPHGERHLRHCQLSLLYGDFNPRSPHGERRGQNLTTNPSAGISIHAPRTGSDFDAHVLTSSEQNFNPRSPHGERQRKVTILSIRIIGFAQKVYHKTVLLRISLAENAVILPKRPRNPVRTSLQKAGGLRFARAIRAARPYSISSPSGA